MKHSVSEEKNKIPKEIREYQARITVTAVQQYFDDPAVRARYEAWKQKKRSGSRKPGTLMMGNLTHPQFNTLWRKL